MSTSVSPPASPASASSSKLFSSPNLATSQTSAPPFTPCKRSRRGLLWTSPHGFDDSDDEDEENVDPRGMLEQVTPKRKLSKRHVTPSPSKFVVKGTVTPSRAAPLFVRYSTNREILKRTTPDNQSSASDVDYDYEESGSDGDVDMLPNFGAAGRSLPSKPRHAQFLPTKSADEPTTRTHLPHIDTFRPFQATENTAAYLMAIRSNALHHLPHAASLRGNHGGSPGRGVLGVSRMLGAGGGSTGVSQRPFYTSFETMGNEMEDLYGLPSARQRDALAHPLCAEYSYSSRSMDNYQAQWLAVGDNEGTLHLLNTLPDPMLSHDTACRKTPRWSACKGSIFELKWRFDDEMIATGTSDYGVRIWSPESGARLRSFRGHLGSPRTLAWDPQGAGNTLVSGGRDGAIHMYDLRVREGSRNGEPWSPCLSLWEAHSSGQTPGVSKGASRVRVQLRQPKAVTSVAFLPGRGSHLLASAGCADGQVKVWDLRNLVNDAAAAGCIDLCGTRRKKARSEEISFAEPMQESIDVSARKNKSSHGISHILTGADKLYAACTDGAIYTLQCADLLQPAVSPLGHPVSIMYHEAQRRNTLFARMALNDNDRTLALACNSGVITVWDTHAASTSLGEVRAHHPPYTTTATATSSKMDDEEEYLSSQVAMARPAIIGQGKGHRSNCEINCVSWAHGPKGPTLASASDDYTIRTWHSKPREENLVRERRDTIGWGFDPYFP